MLRNWFYHKDLSWSKLSIYRFVKFSLRMLLEIFNSLIFIKSNILDELSQQKKSETLIIVGNGPSINKMDLGFLHKYDTLTVNAFHTKAAQLDLRPTFHMVEDNLPAYENKDELKNFDCGMFLIPKSFKWMYPQTKSKCIAFNFIRSALNYRFFGDFKFSRYFERRCYWGGTVLFAALQLARRLEYRRVILIGVDLSYTIPKDAIVSGNIIQTIGADPNHFSGSYFGYGKKWHLPEVERMQIAFDSALTVFKEDKIELVNAGIGGNLKNIPRIDYMSL